MTGLDIFYKLSSIAISLGIFANAYAFRLHARSWVAPAVVFSLFWFLLTFFPLVVMFSVPANPLAILFIWACTFLFGASVFFIDWRRALQLNISRKQFFPRLYAGTFLVLCFYGLQSIVLLCILLNLAVQGFSPTDFVVDLIGSANRYLAARYNGDITPNVFSRAGVILNYVGVSIGGLILLDRKTLLGRLGVFALSFIPAALHMLVYADKGTLFLCAALFYGGVIVRRIHKGDTDLTNKQTNRVIFASILLLCPILIASFMARGIAGGSMSEIIDRLAYYISSYAFGHLYAFSDWFTSILFFESIMDYEPLNDYSYGLYTFMAVFKALGSQAFIPEGYYSEYFNFQGRLQSNIFTIYRGLIQDFSMVGALVYMVISGLIFNIVYLLLLVRAFPVLSAAFYICLIGYVYTSIFISIMVWNSVFALFLVLSLVLGINRYLYRSGARAHKVNVNKL